MRAGFDPATSWLFVGGDFSSIGGVAASGVAARNGLTNAWSALGAGTGGAPCNSLLVRGVGLRAYELTAVALGSTPTVQRWNGTAWLGLGTIEDPWGQVNARLAWHGGQPVLALRTAESAVRRFDGSAFVPVAESGIDGEVRCLLDLGSELVIGGAFRTIAGQTVNGVARGGPGAWQPLGSGFDGALRALVRGANGELFAGGEFTTAGGQTVNRVARWNGAAWAALGSGIDGPVHALAVLPNGDLVAGGVFSTAGGIPSAHVARWNGSSWSPMHGGTTGRVNALWPSGDGVFVGGEFQQAGTVAASRVARWGPSGWSALGAGVDGPVFAFAATRDGALLVGGQFGSAGGLVARCLAAWQGGSWHGFDPRGTAPLGVGSIAVLPDGDLVLGGAIDVGTSTSPVVVPAARWTGRAWQPLGFQDRARVHALAFRTGGELLAGGHFAGAAGIVAGHIARLVATCSATANAAGSGCNGSAGPVTLAPVEPPWTGGLYRAVASGFPPGAVAVELLGGPRSPFPLALVFPMAGPGCDLLVNHWTSAALAASGGVVRLQLTVPALPVLVGARVRQQVLLVELGTNGSITRIGASQALDLTVGVF